MDRDGDNPNSLAEKLRKKTKQPQIFRFLNGVAKEPRRSTLQPVADHYKISVEAFYDPAVASTVMDNLKAGRSLMNNGADVMAAQKKNGTVTHMDQRRPLPLDQLLKDLSAYFVGLDDAAKPWVKSQLANLVDTPENHNSLAEIMATTLKVGNAKPGQERLENSTSSRAG